MSNHTDDMLDVYRDLLALEQYKFSSIEHDDGLVAIVYELTHPTKPSLILKISDRPQDYYRELYFLRLFDRQLPVAKVLGVIEPQNDVHGAILMEHFSGGLLDRAGITEELLYNLGVVLASIHSNRTQGYGDITQPDDLSADPLIYFTSKFEEGIAECRDNLPTILLDKCIHYYEANTCLLSAVDGPCLIHRDFRPGNIMVSGGKLQGVIDWASGRSSFAEEDFCPLELGEWSGCIDNKRVLLDGYSSIRMIPQYEDIMPFLRLSRAIAAIGFTVKRGIWDKSGAKLYTFNRHYLEKFFSI